MFAHCDTLPPASLNEHVPGAGVAKLAYAQDLKSCGSQGRVGSSPTTRTKSPSGDGSTVSAKSDQPSEGAFQGECQPDDMILSDKTGLPKGVRKHGSVYQVDLSINRRKVLLSDHLHAGCNLLSTLGRRRHRGDWRSLGKGKGER